MQKTGSHLKIKSLGTNVLGVVLEGNPVKPEPESFRVHFRGGFVDVSRTTEGDYWVHIGADSGDDANGFSTEGRWPGVMYDARMDIQGYHATTVQEMSVREVANHTFLNHVAARIRMRPSCESCQLPSEGTYRSEQYCRRHMEEVLAGTK